ncbi:MAG: Crp/Fnr family transcriptional regulator [Hyphomicrobiales bacterium]|nr:MAG: Crp/Fnr family transcriptional regulator [Hyphomicrobiales bacterium]
MNRRPPHSPISTPCVQCPIRRMSGFRDFKPKELAFIRSWKVAERRVPARGFVLQEQETIDELYTVLDGWAMKHKTLPDGRRQIINFAMPGDLLGLQASVDKAASHNIEALTDLTLCVLPRKGLWELFRGFAGLSYDITWLAAREEHILGEYLVALGQRTAQERIAFVLLDLFLRARRAALVTGNRMSMPVTQNHLADTAGLSLVHTNKSLQKLRAQGAFAWENSTFELLDLELLANLAHKTVEPAPPRPFL